MIASDTEIIVIADAGIQGPTGGANVYIQQEQPDQVGPWLWCKTDENGNLLDLILAV